MKAILLNGPPYCGKDTIGSFLSQVLPGSFALKFAQPIIDYMTRTFGVSCVDGQPKDEPCPRLYGRTRRQVAIAYSEDFCKPLFGEDYFGREALRAAVDLNRRLQAEVFVFTDSGFKVEADVLIQALGPSNVLHVRVTRPGCDFSKDSRGYWNGGPEVSSMVFDNRGTFGELFNEVRTGLVPTLQRWLTT